MSFTAAEKEILEKPFPVWQRKGPNYSIRMFLDRDEPMEWSARQATPTSEAAMDNVHDEHAGEQDQFGIHGLLSKANFGRKWGRGLMQSCSAEASSLFANDLHNSPRRSSIQRPIRRREQGGRQVQRGSSGFAESSTEGQGSRGAVHACRRRKLAG